MEEDINRPKIRGESVNDDSNINISNVTNIVVGRVGNMFGKGIGGLSTKFGSGNWF